MRAACCSAQYWSCLFFTTCLMLTSKQAALTYKPASLLPWCWLPIWIPCDCVTAKTNPPSRVSAVSEGSPRTLLLTWVHPLPDENFPLDYRIRFCAKGSSSWSNASTFLYHLKTYNLIASFKISSVKHACLVSLRHLSIRPAANLSAYRIFNRTQFTSFKFAAEFLKKAFTGATGVATSPRGHRKIVSLGTIFMTLNNHIYMYVYVHTKYIEWALNTLNKTLNILNEPWNTLNETWLTSSLHLVSQTHYYIIYIYFFKYSTKGKREQWVSPAMNNSWCYLLRCKEATKSQFRSVLTNNQVNHY